MVIRHIRRAFLRRDPGSPIALTRDSDDQPPPIGTRVRKDARTASTVRASLLQNLHARGRARRGDARKPAAPGIARACAWRLLVRARDRFVMPRARSSHSRPYAMRPARCVRSRSSCRSTASRQSRRTLRWRSCGVAQLSAGWRWPFATRLLAAPATCSGPTSRWCPGSGRPRTALLHGDASAVLLADAVGLGKTIQAGIVVAALRARGNGSRVLILTPAGLRDQWRSELERLFRRQRQHRRCGVAARRPAHDAGRREPLARRVHRDCVASTS